LEETFAKNNLPVVKAFREAMKLCFAPDPEKRGSVRESADILLIAVSNTYHAFASCFASMKRLTNEA
jgi:hypothetical protein